MVGNIIDLISLPTNSEVIDTLLAEAMNYFETENVNVVYYMTIKGHPNEKAMNRFGFIERVTHEKLYLLCNFNKIVGSYEFIQNSDVGRLFFCIGDHL